MKGGDKEWGPYQKSIKAACLSLFSKLYILFQIMLFKFNLMIQIYF